MTKQRIIDIINKHQRDAFCPSVGGLAERIITELEEELGREFVLAKGEISLVIVNGDGIDIQRALYFSKGRVVFIAERDYIGTGFLSAERAQLKLF